MFGYNLDKYLKTELELVSQEKYDEGLAIAELLSNDILDLKEEDKELSAKRQGKNIKARRQEIADEIKEIKSLIQPVVKASELLERINKELDSAIEGAAKDTNDFMEKLAKSPLYQSEYATVTLVHNSLDIKVYTAMREHFRTHSPSEWIEYINYVVEEGYEVVIRYAGRATSRSTSNSDRLHEDAVAEWWAKTVFDYGMSAFKYVVSKIYFYADYQILDDIVIPESEEDES